MRNLSLLVLLVALTLASSPAGAGAVEIKVEADGRYLIEKPPGGDPGSVFFTDEKPLIHLTVMNVSDMNSVRADPAKRFVFPTRDWVDAVQLRVFNRGDGIQVPAIARVLVRSFELSDSLHVPRDGKYFFLDDREGVFARVELSGLTPGEYEIEAEIPRVAKTEYRSKFTVRRGNEDLPTIRLHYRYRADKSGDFRKYEAILRELRAKYEPENPGILVMIADWSIDKVPAEETVRLFREARAALEAKWRAELAKDPNVHEIVRKSRQESLETLTVFERVLPYYREHKDELRFGGAFVGGKQVYAWFPRKGGLMLDTIDPANPGRQRTPVPVR